ncbi:organic cation transporter protein-like isoform X2 [Styela clava]
MSPSASGNERYEELMRQVGEFGRFQKKQFLLMALSCVPNGYFALIMVFVGRSPKFECFHPGNDSAGNITATDALPVTFPTTESYVPSSTSNQSLSLPPSYDTYDNCGVFENITSNRTSNGTDEKSCPFGYVYDFEEGRSSIVTEWDLVCDRAWILPLITMLYMSGVLVGSLMGGSLSDRFGRKPTFLFGTLFMFVFLGLCGVSTSPQMFAGFLFCAGATGFINYLTAFTISAEIISTKDRVVTGTLTVGGFAIGYMILPVFAYYIGNWRVLCYVLASLGVVFIPYIWLASESPRWLFTRGRREEFIALFMKIAETNGLGKDKAKSLIQNFFSAEDSMQECGLLSENEIKKKDEPDRVVIRSKQESFTYIDLFRTGVVRSRTLTMWFTWFVCSVVYYGVAFNTSNMGGNPYINCFVAAAVEIPAYAMVIGLLKWRGRKPILISTLLVAGLSCSAVPYLKQINQDMAITFAMIGKLSVSGAFGIIFIVCSELFPTLMRSMGVGSSSMAARVGGMVAPYILYLGKTYPSAPYLIMGLLSLCAAITNTLLPETKDAVLPEKIEDLEPIHFLPCVKLKKLRKRKLESNLC